MSSVDLLMKRLADDRAVLVSVEHSEGSVPREAGAWMAVFETAVLGTVGGGQLEHQALAEARRRLVSPQGADEAAVLRYPLGPSLGQCCGGVVYLRFERVGAQQTGPLADRLRVATMPVALFGGGHVGHALVQVLGTLPCELTWIDSRDGVFPDTVGAHVRCEFSDPVQAAVADLAAGSRVLVMSFSHAEDLDIISACLKRRRERADLPYLGLIGSRTKWATFRRRLAERGFTEAELGAVTCPIGVPGIVGKEPAVIALAAAAQLMQTRA